MTIMVRGDVGAVRTALEAGAKAAKLVGEVESVKMLPNPNLLVEDILPDIVVYVDTFVKIGTETFFSIFNAGLSGLGSSDEYSS